MENPYFTNTIHVKKIELNVSNLEDSVVFYQDLLGFRVISQDSTFVSLSADGQNELIRLVSLSNPIPLDEKLGVYHFAIHLPSRKHLSMFLKHLIEQQIPILGARDHVVTEAIYLQDPDGIGIEIFADKDGEGWNLDLRSIPMTNQPFDYSGVYYETTERETYQRMPSETTIGHLHLMVPKLEEAIAFYTDILGFQLTSKDFKEAAFVSDGNYHHHLALFTCDDQNHTYENEIGLRAFTLEYPTCEKLIHALETLKSHDIPIKETLQGYRVCTLEHRPVYLEIKH
ncbi:MAG: VOC family protein [Candidatus Izemoplasmatales bacterium]|nr:VOC family protein [Candidatus Izemoplasmatales bacterium]